jgi:hypothetical protein
MTTPHAPRPKVGRKRGPSPITVTHDKDGGVTIHEFGSDIVISIIGKPREANGPRTVTIEAYAYPMGKRVGYEAIPPDNLRNPKNPTLVFWLEDEGRRCHESFMAGAECSLPFGHEGSHRV